jgi:uncharacterized protein YhbP (UPF0306 family)
MPAPVEPRILEFISEHHVLTLAVSKYNLPWCAHCFYCYLPSRNLFVFTSDPDTRHISDIEGSGNNLVAAGVYLETRMVGKIRGLQMTGAMRRLEGTELKEGKRAYLATFPVARLTKLHLWGLEPDLMKLTDNRLGFGKKLIWKQ